MQHRFFIFRLSLTIRKTLEVILLYLTVFIFNQMSLPSHRVVEGVEEQEQKGFLLKLKSLYLRIYNLFGCLILFMNRLSRLSCNAFTHFILYCCIFVYCIFNHSILNVFLLLLVCCDVLSLKNVEQYTSKHIPTAIKQTETTPTVPSNRRLSLSPSRINIAYERVSLYDDASYSNWITLFPNMTIRSFLYWSFCLLFIIRHFFLLFSNKELKTASLTIRCIVYAINGGLNQSNSVYYEYFLFLFMAMLNHVLFITLFEIEFTHSYPGE